MTSKNDIFADLFTDFKSSTSSLNLNNKSPKQSSSSLIPEQNTLNKHKTLSNQSLTPSNVSSKMPATYSFDDIFVSDKSKPVNNANVFDDLFVSDKPKQPSVNNANVFDDLFVSEKPKQPSVNNANVFDDLFVSEKPKQSSVNNANVFDDLLMPTFDNVPKVKTVKEESPDMDDNPFETFGNQSIRDDFKRDNSYLRNKEPSMLLDATDHLQDVFSSSSNILKKGKGFFQSQFTYSSEDRMNVETIKNDQQPRRVVKETVVKKEKPAPIVDDFLLLNIDDKPKQNISKSSSTLLDNNINTSSAAVPAEFTIKISNFEKESYFDFKNQGTDAFKIGHYDLAFEKFKTASRSIPKNHIYQVILLRNLISTTFKLGDLSMVKTYLDDVLSRLNLRNYSTWSSYTIQEKQPILLKDLMKKILISKGEYYEMKEDMQQALNTYKEMLDLGLSDQAIIKKKQRLEKILNPQKFVPKASSSIKEKPKVQKAPKVTKEVDTTDIKARVVKKIEMWQSGKATDLRFLLLNLDKILPGWTKLDPKNLISPQKCKIYYFKAINKTHPDKIQQNTNIENRILFENIFMTLNKAWESFKTEM